MANTGIQVDPAPATSETEAPPPVAGETEARPAERSGAQAWNRRHAINIRLSIPLFFGRYYVTLVAGKERRSAARRSEERGKHPLRTTGNVIFFLVLGALTGLAALALIQLGSAFLLESTGLVVAPQ